MGVVGRIELVLMVLGLAGCGYDEQPVPTHTLFGTVTSTTVDASRRWTYIEVMGSNGQDTTAPYKGSCQLSGPHCDYAIRFIPEGHYTVLAFIDMNDNASHSSPEPDNGDLAAMARPLVLWDKTQMDFDDGLWRVVGAP